MNIAINGFGRIGRMILRAAIENDAEINIINIIKDPSQICSAYAASLFKHDSSQRRYFRKVCYDEKHL
ncbi:uncharacterized protein LOC126878563 [Diabrotica virgifera virgifera]|uniref:Glyceraldehyde 3-phosphate dehydrogenase NAD(P) binding domain-containing protein n=1 Tax=Diabrotica virgifera virgifera TaxID=50390 RepID=A0ABM5JH90_DIAVI|nr:uncharacterized protein LOC126878563 [Diabrotica virgifera virgifera]